MSGFIGATLATNIIAESDQRLNRMDYIPSLGQAIFVDMWSIASATFESPWWPKGGCFIGDGNVDVGMLEASWWGEFTQVAGSSSNYGFTGVTRDALGTPIGSCTVKLFKTSNDQLLDTQVSDVNGNFVLATSYYPDTHYIVAHKTASPDVDGATVNTLVGA